MIRRVTNNINSLNNKKITSSDTAPSSAVEGDLWFYTVNGTLLIYHNSFWVDVSTTEAFNGVNVVTSSTRPGTPFEGQVIYETDTNRVLVWDSSAWVVIANASATSFPTSLDTNTVDSIAALQAKVGVDGSAVTTSLDYKIENAALMRRLDVQSFTSSTSYTFPSDAKFVYIEMWSGGAGGNAGESDYASTANGGVGGFPGLFRKGMFPVLNAGSSVPVVVGSGGAGGVATLNGTGGDGNSWGTGGGAGGYSSFGTYLTVFGPNGGYRTGRYYPYSGWDDDYAISTSAPMYDRLHLPTGGGDGGNGLQNSTYATSGLTAPKVWPYGTNPVGNLYTLNSPYPHANHLQTGAAGGQALSPYDIGYSGGNGVSGGSVVVDGVNWRTYSGGGGGGGSGSSSYYWFVQFGGFGSDTEAGSGGDGGFPAGGGGGGGGANEAEGNYRAIAGGGGDGGNGLVQIMVFG